uniref:uncharacterized protein LOC105353271 n=1 Tax=Fragaria vesca subsp. vesca TaxID=101020 RepID=UPI0005CB5A1F|nr:PREDICTED: uncharacterized protein LOC105353271 [Fragaria vesca subsp. vesca]
MEKEKLIRLDEGWVSVAINSLDSFGNVKGYDFWFLDQVLPHCNKNQLAHIENSTKGVDLTPITDKLWKNFFKRDFGDRALDETMEKMKMKKVSFRWSELYQAKSRSLEKKEKEVGERLKKMYEKEDARKQSRQVKVLDKVPPSNKRIGVINKGLSKGRKSNPIMNKLKKQYENSLAKRNLDFVKMKRTAVAARCSDLIKEPRMTVQAMNVDF